MKAKFYSLLTIMILITGCSVSQVSVADNPRWEKLGQRTVNYKLDKDEIRVTAREGSFNSIKLAFKGGALNMHKCIIHFANGQSQKVNLKKRYGAGDESRIIDIKGGQRIISKVIFWYDTKNLARRKASVQLWGRH